MLLRLITSDGAEMYDLIEDDIYVSASGAYMESTTMGGMRERRFGVVGAYSSGTSRMQIMTAAKKLNDMGRKAREWIAQPERAAAVWLQETAEDETMDRRALVYDVILEREAAGGITPMLGIGHFFGTLTIITTPYFEASTSREADFSNVDTIGQVVYIDGGGTVDGRISNLLIDNSSTNKLYKGWMGIREVGQGYSDFEPIMSFSERAATTTGVSIVGTQDTNTTEAAQIAFSTDASLIFRHGVYISDVTGRYKFLSF